MNGDSIIEGNRIDENELRIERSRNIYKALVNNPFTELIEIRRNLNEDEIFIFEVEVELPQKLLFDIKLNEPMSVVVHASDEYIPEVYALRKDFPQLSHQNLRSFEIPKSLCLYEEPFNELKLTWSSVEFIERIRDWLRLSALGKLHAKDQPLESLLGINNKFLILPPDFYDNSSDTLFSVRIINSENSTLYLTEPFKENKNSKNDSNFVFTKFQTKPFIHGVINKIPTTIYELNLFLQKVEFNLIEELRIRLLAWSNINENIPFFNLSLIIAVILPKKRSLESASESQEIRIFKTKQSIIELGKDLGCWDISEKKIGRLLQIDTDKVGLNIEVEILNAVETFTKASAKFINGINIRELKFSVIGLGSLGSQIFNILARQGLGQWTLIDNDIIFPHNLGRHILNREHIGLHKVKVLSDMVNNLYQENICKFFLNNFLDLKAELNSEIFDELNISKFIFDFSASIPVARSVCNDINSNARRISCFFTPNGQDSVLIAEDTDRKNKLDMLEIIYYRALVENSHLNNHLNFEPLNKIRYGYSCRDISSRIPFDLTAQHAAFCATEIKFLLKDQNSNIKIWQTLSNNEIKKISIEISEEFREGIGDWIIVYDKIFMDKIYNYREEKLPKETGGVLIGSYDIQRKIIYIVDTIPSPPDSVEWPITYIRGFKGLLGKVNNYKKITDSMLHYIGEWHSHPKGCSSKPSMDDIKAFTWLTGIMDENERPALMLIAGEDHTFYLGEMKTENHK
jgi:integrative and conjugative element protein (TIGR02256 family)